MGNSHPSRTERGTMKIRRIADGLVIERQPPDAHAMAAADDFEFVPADTPSVPEIVAGLTEKQLRELLVWPAAGTDRAFLVRAVTEKVEAGDLELPE